MSTSPEVELEIELLLVPELVQLTLELQDSRSADNININHAEYLLLIDLAADLESCMLKFKFKLVLADKYQHLQ